MGLSDILYCCREWVLNLFHKKRKNAFHIRDGITLVLVAIGHKRKILLPTNFDLENHLVLYPPYMYGYTSKLSFNRGKLYYFLSLLSSIPARNKDLIDDEGWVPINIGLARNSIKDIVWYKDYLVKTGILECDNIYTPGVKSFCYRWAEPYRSGDFIMREVTCPHEDTKYFANEELDDELQEMPYLSYWYSQNYLSVDYSACRYAEAIYKAKTQGLISWDSNANTGKKKNPKIQYEASLINLDKLLHHQYEVHIDTNVHRLHSVITNIQSDLRNFLSYKGECLVDVDIHNCQPYLACALLNPQFWSKDSSLSLSLFSLPQNIQSKLLQNEVYVEIQKFFKTYQKSDFQAYINKVASGQFYEEFAAISKEKLNKQISRKEAKTLMFYILFSSNQGQHEDPVINHMKNIFCNDVYPQVAEFFKIIKRRHKSISDKKQHNRLACLLQNIESEIILHRCCKRIWEDGKHNIPVFTIHDCIATTVENKNFIEKIMREEFTKAIGIAPTLGIEEWKISNIEHPQLLK